MKAKWKKNGNLQSWVLSTDKARAFVFTRPGDFTIYFPDTAKNKAKSYPTLAKAKAAAVRAVFTHLSEEVAALADFRGVKP